MNDELCECVNLYQAATHAITVTLLAIALFLQSLAAWCAHLPRAQEVFKGSEEYLFGLPGGRQDPIHVPLWAWIWGKRRWNGHFGARFPNSPWADPKSAPVFKGASYLLIGLTFLLRFAVGAEPPWELFT